MASAASENIYCSDGLPQWLHDHRLSLGFTTYQANKLFLVGCTPDRRIAVNVRLFDKPMGLCASDDGLVMSTRYSIWRLENRLAADERQAGCDRLYVPGVAHTTGDLNVHDVAVDKHGQILFINTDFSCLARLCPGYSFEPVWRPPFISALKAEDRCHLNGLGMRDGEAVYATACGATDDAAGWRNCRADGGIVLHIPSNDIIATGLAMPHSPRWHRDRLWLLNAGTGELGFLDGARFVAVTFCPGFVRGLAFAGNYALVGLSRLRSSSFGGLPLERRLADAGQTSRCGVLVIDTDTGAIVQSLYVEDGADELFDVVALHDVQRPKALGFQDTDIERLVSFPGSGGLVRTKPTVQRPGKVKPAATPRPPGDAAAVSFQRVYHLTPDNLAPYDEMTYPRLRQRWQTQRLRGELLGVSAAIAGEMVGFAVAEQFTGDDDAPASELLSLFVLPAYRRQGIAARLVKHLQRLLAVPFNDVDASKNQGSM